jgi:zinc protease
MLGLFSVWDVCSLPGRFGSTYHDGAEESEAMQDEATKGPGLWRLENGMQVLVQEDRRFPLAVMRVFIRAGSALETEHEAGLTHLLEHMAFRSGGSEPGVASEIEALGGRVNAATGFDHTTYMVDLPANAWQRGLETLRRLCFGMDWDESDLATEKEVVISELERRLDDPGAMLFERMQASVWAGTAYARPIVGSRETIRELGLREVREYVERLYQPQAMLLVVCGDVDQEEVLREAQRQFSGHRNDRPLAASAGIAPVRSGEGPKTEVVSTPWNKVYAGIGFPVSGLTSPDTPKLEVLGYILGGDPSSRLVGRFKHEEGLVDEIAVSPVLLRDAGMLLVQAYLDPDRVEEFVSRCFHELTLLDPMEFGDEEVARAGLNIEDSLFQSKETLAGLAAKLGHFQFVEGDLEGERRYLQAVRHVRKEDFLEPVRAYLGPENAHIHLLVGSDRADGFQGVGNGLSGTSGSRTSPVHKASGKNLGETRVRELANGCRLVLIPDRTLPYQAVDITWPGGDLLLGEEEQGLAALTAEGLLRGTGTRNHARIREMLSQRAASLDAAAGRDQFSLTAKLPSRYQQEILDLVREVIADPALSEAETARAAAEQTARLTERMDHPMGLLAREVFPFLFQDHPYGYYHLGRPEGLDGFGPDILRQFWARQLRQPFVLSVCGEMDCDAVEETAVSLARKASEPREPLPGQPVWNPWRQLDLGLAQRNQAHILIVFPVPGLESEEYPHLALWKKILGGQDGILFRELRDRQGLGYAVDALLWNAPGCGFLGFYLGTYPDRMESALESFRNIVNHLGTSGVSPRELERAKNIFRADYYRGLQPLMGRSGEASELLARGLPLDFQRRTAERVADLGREELRDVAARYASWDRAYTVLLRPE